MDLHLAGKTAVVTGASKGIGFAITRALAGEGVSVVAGARTTTTELSDLAARTTVTPVSVDLTSPDGPARLIEAAIEWLRAHGAPRVMLWTAERNPAAQSLFGHLGFRRTMIEMTREL